MWIWQLRFFFQTNRGELGRLFFFLNVFLSFFDRTEQTNQKSEISKVPEEAGAENVSKLILTLSAYIHRDQRRV